MFLTMPNLEPVATGEAWADKSIGYGHRGMIMAGGPDTTMFALFGILCIATWVLVIALLIVLVRYFWKLGDKVK